MKRRVVLLFLLLQSICTILCAQPLAERSLSRDSIEVGDSLLLRLKIQTGRGAELFFPNLPDTLGGGLEVYAAPRLDTLVYDENQGFLAEWKLPLVAYDTGWLVVPDIPVLVQFSGRMDTVYTQPSLVHVAYVPMDETVGELNDIRGPLEQSITFLEILPWLLGGMGVLLAAIVFYLWRRYRQQQRLPFVPKKPSRPPAEIALELLRALLPEEVWLRKGAKSFYTEMTDALRGYLEAAWQIRTLEETTAEILAALRAMPDCTEEHYMQFLRILQRSDLVKFARYEPTSVERGEDLAIAIQLVEEIAAQIESKHQMKDNVEEGSSSSITTELKE